MTSFRKLILPVIASLFITTSFALTPQECGKMLEMFNNRNVPNIVKLKNLTPSEIVECSSSSYSKQQVLSPLNIFQIIINALAALTFGLAIIAIAVSVIKIATSIGDKTKFNEGVSLLKNAALAIVLVFVCYSILSALLKTFGFEL